MNPEEKLLIELIKGKAKQNSYKNIDWNKFTDLCFYHKISQFIYDKFDKSIVPKKTLDKFKEKNRQITIENMILEKEAKGLFREFERKEIEYIAFKGIALNHWLYPESFSRQSSDIDFLIKEKEYKKAFESCKKKGFKGHAFNAWKKIPFKEKLFGRFYSNQQHFPLMEKNEKIRVVIEPHKKLFFPVNCFRINYEELWADSVKINSIRIPGKEDSIIISVLSAVYQHAFYGIFEALIDVQNMLKQKPDLKKLKEKTIKYNITEPMIYFNELTKEFFGTEIKELKGIKTNKNKMDYLRKKTASLTKMPAKNPFFFDLQKMRVRLYFTENLMQKIKVIFFVLFVSGIWKTINSVFRKE